MRCQKNSSTSQYGHWLRGELETGELGGMNSCLVTAQWFLDTELSDLLEFSRLARNLGRGVCVFVKSFCQETDSV